MPERRPPRVFISSTAADLRTYREAACDAVLDATADSQPRMMEYFEGRGDHPSLPVCLEKVADADVVVAIVAHRYGWEPPDQLGRPDEQKKRHALVAAIDMATPELLAEVQRRIKRLATFTAWLDSAGTRPRFTSPDDFRAKVLAALHGWRGRHPEFSGATPRPVRPADATQYLRLLRDQTASIDIRGLQVGSGQVHRFPIEDLYIGLTTIAAATGGARRRGERRDESDLAGLEGVGRVPLHHALSHPRLVITGDPGAGKTTFLRRVAHVLGWAWLGEDPDAARTQLGLGDRPFPILVEVDKLSEHIEQSQRQAGRRRPTTREAADWLPHFLAVTGESAQWGLDEAFFRTQLRRPCALLVDGLDQAPTRARRESLCRLVENIARTYGQCRIVVTSRPAADVGASVLTDFAHAQIDPLDDGAIETFLGHWCAQVWAASPTEAARYQGELLEALRVPAIRRIARNPVMLTALAVVHWNEKRLPEQRADLYESVITWLARSREQRPGRAAADACVTRLAALAMAMHAHPRGRQLQVSRREAAEAIAAALASRVRAEHVAAAEKFLDEEEVDSGIVVGRGDDIRFWHLTFQEFLAARAIAGRLEKDQREILLDQPGRLYSTEWREVVMLLAGLLHKQGPGKLDGFASALIDRLGPKPAIADRARAVGLLGAIVRDLAPFTFEVADPRYGELQEGVLPIFDRQHSASIPVEVRIEAADALGQPGDPRLEPWVAIPAGMFLMGAQSQGQRKPGYDREAVERESPAHHVDLDAYRIGRYPVTVGEYRRFIEDGGYDEARWWRVGGFRRWSVPWEWDGQSQFPNRPVVGVSWFEASAFCTWARNSLGWSGCRLPTEAEWERAARGTDGRRFPWGDDDAEPSRHNYDESHIGHATPVGIYPLGATPDEIHDLAGNVWEWCQDWFGPYDHGPTSNPRGLSRGEYRVLRGGSWYRYTRLCRAAYRYGNHPPFREAYIGFRVVVGIGGGPGDG